MNIGKRYQDMMDSTRIVVPTSVSGKSVSCRVYFRNGDRFDFCGKTDISVNLFTGTKFDPHMAERIGFMLINE